jgi:hypothetical protein
MRLVNVFACASVLVSSQSALGQPSVQGDSVKAHAHIILDGGYNPFGELGSWGPRFSVRLACHLPSLTLYTFDVSINVLYTQYGLEDEFATGVQHVEHYPSVRREDLAAYFSVRASFLELGAGMAYVRSDDVVFLSASNQFLERWPWGGLSTVTYFVTFGFVGEIVLGRGIFVPIGFHYTLPTYHATHPFMGRVGLGYLF